MRHPKAMSGAVAIGLAVALLSAGCASSDSAPTSSESASAANLSTSAVAFTPIMTPDGSASPAASGSPNS